MCSNTFSHIITQIPRRHMKLHPYGTFSRYTPFLNANCLNCCFFFCHKLKLSYASIQRLQLRLQHRFFIFLVETSYFSHPARVHGRRRRSQLSRAREGFKSGKNRSLVLPESIFKFSRQIYRRCRPPYPLSACGSTCDSACDSAPPSYRERTKRFGLPGPERRKVKHFKSSGSSRTSSGSCKPFFSSL